MALAPSPNIQDINICDAKKYADHFCRQRRYTRTVSFPHPKGKCCVCCDGSGLKMKCGHYICPDDILNNAWKQISNSKHEITCVACTRVFDVDEILKFGLPSEQESQFLTTALSFNFLSRPDETIELIDKNQKKVNVPRMRACPGCKTLLQHDGGCNEMTCDLCRHSFCYICLSPTKGMGSVLCKSTTWNVQAPITCKPAPV